MHHVQSVKAIYAIIDTRLCLKPLLGLLPVGFSPFKSWVPSSHNFSSGFQTVVSILPPIQDRPHNFINSTILTFVLDLSL